MGALLEREAELAALHEAVRALHEGAGGAVLVEGPAGIGKSALLDAAGGMGMDAGAQVLRTRGTELEHELAFGAVRHLLGAAVMHADEATRTRLLKGPAQLARPVLGLAGAAPATLGDPLYGLYWLIANLADAEPVLVAVDDLHWLDEESGRFVAYLARRIEGMPVLLVATARRGEPGASRPWVEEIAAQVRRLTPAPLSAGAVARLATAVSGPGAERLGPALLTATGGNPLLVEQVARSLGEPGERAELAAPVEVGRMVLGRAARISAAATALAHAVSLFPAGAPLRDAAAVAGLDPAPAASAADGLVAAGILAEGDALTFAHPAVRAAVYADLPHHARRRAHARAAAALRERGAGDEDVAAHLLAGAPEGDAASVAVLRRAASAAQDRGALRAAVRYLERAVAEPPPADERPALAHELGRLQVLVGAPGAVAALSVALQGARDPGARADAAIDLAAACFADRRYDEAAAVLSKARQDAGELDPERRLTVDGVLAAAAWESERHAGVYVQVADSLPRELPGRTPGERIALAQVAARMFDRCEPHDHVLATAQRAVGDDPSPLLVSGVDLGDPLSIIIACGALEPAAELCRARQQAARETGRDALYAAAEVGLARVALLRGELPAAEGILQLALELPGLHPVDEHMLATLLASVCLEQGRLDAAEQWLARGGTGASVELRRARVALRRGRAAEALPVYERVHAARVALGSLNPSETLWHVEMAEALRSVGRHGEALALLENLLERAQRFGEPLPLGLALGAIGRATGERSRLEQALAVLEPTPYALHAAAAAADLGAALRRANRRLDARELLSRALDAAHRAGAATLAALAEDELRASGAKPRRRAAGGSDALTPSELRVARLAAGGMTNRQIAQHLFLTMKTVEMHLGRCYRKLGIESRAKLAGALPDPAGTEPA